MLSRITEDDMTALFLCCFWGVTKGKEQRREGMHESKNADLARKVLANRLLHLQGFCCCCPNI